MYIIKHFTQLREWEKEGFVCTIGNFDGVHIAHKKIMSNVKRIAKKRRKRSLVITFDYHPLQVGAEKKKPILTFLDHKLLLLSRAHIDACFVFSFRKELRNVDADSFLRKILFKKFPIEHLIVGYNFRFGKDRKGTPRLIQDVARKYDVSCSVQQQVLYNNNRISSTRLRMLVARGKLAIAEKMLGRKYSVFATVVSGAGRGKTILGFPTANLDVHSEVLPPQGVYVVRVTVHETSMSNTKKGKKFNEHCLGKKLLGVLNFGSSPTFDDGTPTHAEVHIINGVKDNLRGKLLEVEFYKRIRNERKFPSVQSLCRQIETDIKYAVRYF